MHPFPFFLCSNVLFFEDSEHMFYVLSGCVDSLAGSVDAHNKVQRTSEVLSRKMIRILQLCTTVLTFRVKLLSQEYGDEKEWREQSFSSI